ISILQNLRIDALDAGVKVMGCDGEMWVERNVACMVHEGGSICLQAKLLNELVASMPDGDVELKTLNGHGALLQQGASEYRLQTLDAADFPEAPEITAEAELTLPMGELKKAVDSVIYAVSQDTHRQVLTGVLFRYDGQTLTLVATDTHRLAVRRVSRPGGGSEVNAVVPERALRAIRLLPLGDDDAITLKFGNGRIGGEAGGAKVGSPLLNGAY